MKFPKNKGKESNASKSEPAAPSSPSPFSSRLNQDTGNKEPSSRQKRLEAHIARLEKKEEKATNKFNRFSEKQEKRDHRFFFNQTINEADKKVNQRFYRVRRDMGRGSAIVIAALKKPVVEYHKGIHKAIESGEQETAGLRSAHKIERKTEKLLNQGYTKLKSRVVDHAYHRHRKLNILQEKKELKSAKLQHKREKKEYLVKKSELKAKGKDLSLKDRELLRNEKRKIKKNYKQQKEKIFNQKLFHQTTKDKRLARFSKRHRRRMAIMEKGSVRNRMRQKIRRIIWRFLVPLAILILLMTMVFTSCALFTNSNGGVATTTYNADPEAMLAAERMFSSLEYTHIYERVLNFRAEKPGYDRYEYNVDPIGHEIHALQAYLNTKHIEYDSLESVAPTLFALIEKMYNVSYEEKTDVWYEEILVEDEHGERHIEYVEHTIRVIVLHIRRTPQEETIHNLALADFQNIADPKDREEKIAHYVDMRKLQGNMPELFEFQTWSSPVKYMEVVDENGNVATKPLINNQPVELVEGSALNPYDPNYRPNQPGYANGHCTQYVYYRLAANGKMIPTNLSHAKNWASNAAAAGYVVDNRATPGSIICFPAGWSAPGGAYNSDPNYGHVAVVEKVENGVVYFSDMNFAGQNGVVKTHKLTGNQLAGTKYIHP